MYWLIDQGDMKMATVFTDIESIIFADMTMRENSIISILSRLGKAFADSHFIMSLNRSRRYNWLEIDTALATSVILGFIQKLQQKLWWIIPFVETRYSRFWENCSQKSLRRLFQRSRTIPCCRPAVIMLVKSIKWRIVHNMLCLMLISAWLFASLWYSNISTPRRRVLIFERVMQWEH